MKKTLIIAFFFSLALVSSAQTSQPAYHGPLIVGYWLMPFINTQAQADNLVGYDVLVIHNEIIYSQSPWIDYILKKNPSLILIAYFNPPEWFNPAYENCPWAIKMTSELKQGERQKWWLNQPNGNPVSFWTGADGRKTAIMDMRDNAVLINGERYYEYIAKRFTADILADKRVKGMEVDNAWPDAFWLGHYGQNKGVDFNRDKKADNNALEIDGAWKSGQAKFIKLIRELKGKDFIILANPGTLHFNFDISGKNFENFPFEYAGDMTNGGWNITMFNATKTGPYSVLQARVGNWFFTLCSTLLLDKVCFSDIQNAPYRPEFKIPLGKPLEDPPLNFKKNLPVYSRRYEAGTVYVNPQKKIAWITNAKGDTIYDTKGNLAAKR